jgi:hypothetical protein
MMQAYELVELGAWIALHGRAFVRGAGRLSESGIGQYWSLSRCRFDRWLRAIQVYNTALESGSQKHAVAWRRVRPVLEEIFTGEILTRVWTAVACEHDRRRGANLTSPVVRNVYAGHLEARNRALNLMFHAQDRNMDDVLAVNQVRCLSERWTDMLLAYLLPDCDVAQLAFDKRRARDFSEDVREQLQGARLEKSWRLLRAALRKAFRPEGRGSRHAELHAPIAASIRACFPAELLDSASALSTLWLDRLAFAAADTEAMIEELMAVT